MKKHVLILLAVFGLLFSGSSRAQSAFRSSGDTYEEEQQPKSRLNNKRLEKNLDRYAGELQLSSRQVKKIGKLGRKYARKERRLKRRSSTKRRDVRALQERKREEMIGVLTADQQKKLEALSKRGILDFFR